MRITMFVRDLATGFIGALPEARWSCNTPKFPTVPVIQISVPIGSLNAQYLKRDNEVYMTYDYSDFGDIPVPLISRSVGAPLGQYEVTNGRYVLENPEVNWDESANVPEITWVGRGMVSVADRALLMNPSAEASFIAPGGDDPATFWTPVFGLYYARGGIQRVTLTPPGNVGDGSSWQVDLINGQYTARGGGMSLFKYDSYNTDYLAGLISCVDDYSLMDLTCSGTTINFWMPGTVGVDLTVLPFYLIDAGYGGDGDKKMFVVGQNVLEIQDVDSDYKDIRNAGVILYTDGSVTTVQSSKWNGLSGTAQRYSGYDRREVAVTSDWPIDPAVTAAHPTWNTIALQVANQYKGVKTFAISSLDQVTAITPSVSFSIDETSDIQPYRDFDVFDTVPCPRAAGGWTNLQVVDISVTRDSSGSTRYGIVCGEPRFSVTEKLSAYARQHFGKHTKVGKELWKTYQHW